jgi:predicted phage tail component-like protein
MADWFQFAGRHSSYFGVVVENYPPITTPEERVQFEPVPGRSGSLTLIEGGAVYDDIVLSLDCFVRDLTTVDQIAAWLRGSGDLILGNMPDRYYKARCVNQIEFSKILRGRKHRRFAAVFRCSPYRYLYPEPTPQIYTTGPDSINNPGTVDAVPTITVVGSGNIDLTIGAKTIHIASLASAITIDGETGMAHNGTTDLTPSVAFDWPLVIPPGISAVSWTGTVTSVTITRPWRYI